MEAPIASRSIPAGAKTSYIPALDGIRAIAFLFVFGAHSTGRTISRLIPATFGVTIFFFLSGYLITTLLRQELQQTGTVSLRDFYIRRALRIFLPLYAAYLVVFCVDRLLHLPAGNTRGLLSAVFYYWNYARMLSPATQVPGGLDVIWSLSVEEHFYIIFPLLFLGLARLGLSARSKVRLLLGLCLFGLAWRLFVETHHFPAGWTYFATDCRFDSILWGSLLALWNNPRLDEASLPLQRHAGLLAFLAVVVLVLSMSSQSLLFRDTFRYSLQGFCLYFVFFFCISSSAHLGARWLENPALRYLGWISYSMYLIHVAVLDLVTPHLPPKDWISGPVGFLISLLYALAIRHALELPLQRVRRRFRHAPPPVSAAIPIEGI